MSSCNLGTLASFALLPISDVVVRSSVKSGDMENVTTGAMEVGGVMMIDDLKREREIVKDTGKRAKDDIG